MNLYLDHHSGEAIYRQIVEQIKYKIACGKLVSGDQLVSIRALAQELKINPRTVVKAYEELNHAGLVVLRQGQGVFVAENREFTPVLVRAKAIGDLARRLLSEARRLGANSDEVIAIVKKTSLEMEDGGPRPTLHMEDGK